MMQKNQAMQKSQHSLPFYNDSERNSFFSLTFRLVFRLNMTQLQRLSGLISMRINFLKHRTMHRKLNFNRGPFDVRAQDMNWTKKKRIGNGSNVIRNVYGNVSARSLPVTCCDHAVNLVTVR